MTCVGIFTVMLHYVAVVCCLL